jgi:hypothetical protein
MGYISTMEIFVSIDGVLRNTIQKFDYHYKDYYLNTESTEEETFDYGINNSPISIKNLLNSYRFQSIDEFNRFLYFDFPIEIYGHAGLSYNHAATDFNKLIFENPDINFTIIGLSEKGKSKPASLFFLSKNDFTNKQEINKLSEIEKKWLKYSEKTITSILMGLVKNVRQVVTSKMKMGQQH